MVPEDFEQLELRMEPIEKAEPNVVYAMACRSRPVDGAPEGTVSMGMFPVVITLINHEIGQEIPLNFVPPNSEEPESPEPSRILRPGYINKV